VTLFDECIEVLKKEGEVTILSEEETKEIINEFEKNIPPDSLVTRVDFSQISRKTEIEEDEDILKELYKNHVNVHEPVYVFWNDADLPAIRTSIKNVIHAIEDVIAVSFDTYIFCPKERYIVEYYHEGETCLGFY